MQKRWWLLIILILVLLIPSPPDGAMQVTQELDIVYPPPADPWRNGESMDIGLSMHGNQLPGIVDDEGWWSLFYSSGFNYLLSYVYTIDTLLNFGDHRAFTEQLPTFQSIADRMDGTDTRLIITVDAGEGYTDRYFTALIPFLDAMQPYADQVVVAPYYAEWFNYLYDLPNRYRNGGAGQTVEGAVTHDWTDIDYVLERMNIFMGYTAARGFQLPRYLYNVWPYGAVSNWQADGSNFVGMSCSMNTGVEPPTMPEHKGVMSWIDSRYPTNGSGLDLMQWSSYPNQYYAESWVNEALIYGESLSNCYRLSFGGDADTINYVASTVEAYTGGAPPPDPPPDPPDPPPEPPPTAANVPMKVKHLFLVDEGTSLDDVHQRQTHYRHNLYKLATIDGKDLYVEY